jgi:hypothetical protein
LLVQVNQIYIQPTVSKFNSRRSMQWPLLAWWISPYFTICCLINYNSQFRCHLFQTLLKMSKLVFACGYVAAVFPVSSQLQHDLVKVVFTLYPPPCHLLIYWLLV